MIHEDSSFCTTEEHSFEAVALDCAFASHSSKKSKNVGKTSETAETSEISEKSKTSKTSEVNDINEIKKNHNNSNKENISPQNSNKENVLKKEFCFLILAGLTGGSEEAYVLDLVNTANEQGRNQVVDII